ncbi:hypothetical protein CLV58_13139 [Spirosoma oryzae]|uniref:Transmembrane protein n=1 Tax=Spirosoma oryzae TaxID=1469603 RepID=A0A2T0S326_9BACT|nr:hypothetical protein [Spirosoma oryzae]PRY27821.1 hypothetical protein CLV58_13139 [Spirosoma oryzae]
MMARPALLLHEPLRRLQFRLHRRCLRLIRQWETKPLLVRRYQLIAVTLLLLAIFLPSLLDGIRGLSEFGSRKPGRVTRLTGSSRVQLRPMEGLNKAPQRSVTPGDTHQQRTTLPSLAPQPTTH